MKTKLIFVGIGFAVGSLAAYFITPWPNIILDPIFKPKASASTTGGA